MNEELTSLENRLAALLDAHQRLRGEHAELSVRVSALQTENKRLAGKVALATEKVESLLASLPVEESADEQ